MRPSQVKHPLLSPTPTSHQGAACDPTAPSPGGCLRSLPTTASWLVQRPVLPGQWLCFPPPACWAEILFSLSPRPGPMSCALAAWCPMGAALPLPTPAQRDPLTCLAMMLTFLCCGTTEFHSITGVPGPIQVIIPLTPALMAEHFLPTVLYLCRELSLLTHNILHLFLLNRIQVFQVASPVQQSNFKFQSCLPGHLQPSHLSQCPCTNRNADQIPSRPWSSVCCIQLISVC